MTSTATDEIKPSEAVTPVAGKMLGRAGGYDLMVELASGGMATVFLARGPKPEPRSSVRDLEEVAAGPVSEATSRLAAVKRPHPHLAKDPIYTSMLLDEARLASAIRHPNVVRVRELGFEAEHPFIVMDYVEGASLVEVRRALAEVGRALDVPVALRIALDALAGLHAAHELRDDSGRLLGIIHRDISPHNVLVGSDGIARLTDFGIAKAEDRVQVTRTHEVKGKLAYMAPERVDSRRICTVQSDVFSMAVVLWESLAGRRLFRGDEPVHVLDAVLHAPIPKLRTVGASHVSPELDDVIARALSRDLSVRFANAAEFATALQRVGARIGNRDDVARVIETVFSPRLRVIHESVRHAVGVDEADFLFRTSGITPRPRPSPSMPLSTPEIFGAVGTEVPSDRYVLGDISEPAAPPKKSSWKFVALGAALLVLVSVASVMALRARAQTAARVSDPVTASAAPPVPTTRRVTVMLPAPAVRVTLRDQERTFGKAVDNVVFDVPNDVKSPHQVKFVGDDGAMGEGAFVEEAGVAKADPGTLLVTRPASTSPKTPVKGKDVGTRRNGFTKLK